MPHSARPTLRQQRGSATATVRTVRHRPMDGHATHERALSKAPKGRSAVAVTGVCRAPVGWRMPTSISPRNFSRTTREWRFRRSRSDRPGDRQPAEPSQPAERRPRKSGRALRHAWEHTLAVDHAAAPAAKAATGTSAAGCWLARPGTDLRWSPRQRQPTCGLSVENGTQTVQDPLDGQAVGPNKKPRLSGAFHEIGETGFEPATARPPAGCATRLRHSPWSGDDIPQSQS